jgi:hypothetical protein
MTTGDPRAPAQLRVVGATDLERRLLEAAAADRPPVELRRRMGEALGLAIASGGAAAGGVAAGSAAPAAGGGTDAASAATASSAWPLVTLGAVALLAAGIGGAHWVRGRHPAPAPSAAALAGTAPVFVAAPAARGEASGDAAPGTGTGRRLRAAASVATPRPGMTRAPGDLRAEIALIDAARGAVATEDDERALALLHRYDAAYPGGTLRPEAMVVRIEALANLGRKQEARTLARRFMAAHPDNPLADRVAHLTN